VESLTATRVAAITDDLIVSAVGDDHRLVDANKAWTTALGWKEEELLGACLARFITPRDRGRVMVALAQLEDDGDIMALRVEMVGATDLVNVSWRFCRQEANLYGVGRVVGEAALESRVQQVLERHEQRTSDFEEAAVSASLAETKARTWKTWLAAGVLAASAVGGALAWAVDKIENSVEQAHEMKQREKKVDTALESLEGRADTTDKKFQRVGGVLIETQVQVSDSTDYIVNKIDAVWPKRANDVKAPPTVRRARTKVKAIKDKREIDEFFKFDADAPDDPFAGIEIELPPSGDTGTGTGTGS
jgi:hypothetical protein